MPNIELDASQIPRLMKCRGNYRFLNLPKGDLSEAQKESAIAFRVLVNVLENKDPREGLEEHDVDQEMIDCANMTASKIWEDGPGELHFEDQASMEFSTHLGESKFNFHKLHVRPNLWYIDKNDIMVLIDYKYGYKVEEVVDNWRLISQALVTAHEYSDGETPVPDCKVVIAQPRASHHLGFYRTWEVSARELIEEYLSVINGLFQKLHKAELKDVSGSHCLYCPGFSKCQTANDTATQMVEVVKDINKQDLELTNKQKGVQLELIDEIFTFLKHKKQVLEDELKETIEKGGRVPGYKTAPGKSSYEWKGSEEEVRRFFKLMAGKDPVVSKLLSPNQCSKELNIPRKLVDQFTVKKQGSTKLVRSSVEDEAAQLFGKGKV